MKAKVNLFRTLLVLWVAVVAVAVALFGVGLRTAETQTTPTTYYKVQALGTLPGDTSATPSSIPYGINDLGHVVGESTLSGSSEGMNGISHAFLYENGAMRDLGTLPGYPYSIAYDINNPDDINNPGQIVGWSLDISALGRAFLYEDGQMKDLGALPGDTYSLANGINDSGQIVGWSYDSSYKGHAFFYDSTNGMKDLGTLGGPSSSAVAINNSGQVIGWSDTASGERPAFLYENGQMKVLGTLGGPSSVAQAINNSGQVVGWSHTSSGISHAFLYEDGQMKDLGTLPGDTHSFAYDINDSGQVVGSTSRGFFLYQNGEMIDLGTRLHPDNNGNVWNLRSADAINNEGQIVAEGWRKESDGITYTYSALLLTPTSDTPPPPDTTKPSTSATRSIEPNAAGWNKENVTVRLNATDSQGGSGVQKITYSASGAQSIAKTDAPGDSVEVALDQEGTTTLTYYATDKAGNVEDQKTLTLKIDKSAPTGSVSINDGASRTRTQSVTLTLSATDPSPGSGVSQMRISNTQSGLASSSWEAYSTTKEWPLSSGTGTKTVYVQYRDGAGNDSADVTDTIRYAR